MAMMPRMELRQGQSLVMTPQLLQAIKLLQLSHLELQNFVEGELERSGLHPPGVYPVDAIALHEPFDRGFADVLVMMPPEQIVEYPTLQPLFFFRFYS